MASRSSVIIASVLIIPFRMRSLLLIGEEFLDSPPDLFSRIGQMGPNRYGTLVQKTRNLGRFQAREHGKLINLTQILRETAERLVGRAQHHLPLLRPGFIGRR